MPTSRAASHPDAPANACPAQRRSIGWRASRRARAIVAGLVLLSGACTAEVDPPNIVLVTIDTLRADHLSFYGYSRETTPNLSSWIGEAAVFENTYTPLPLTDPSMTSLMTGLYPMRHGVRHVSRRFRLRFTTLAQVLRARGYATAAFASRIALVDRENLGRGFEVADFVAGEPGNLRGMRAEAERMQRRAPSVTAAALEWLEAAPSRPFFLWLHYFDPHAYYDPPAPFRDRFSVDLEPEPAHDLRAWWGAPPDVGLIIARYDAEILSVDHHLARVVEALERQEIWDSTLFVLTSDHGESLGEHGHLDHGEWLYQEQVRVPLVMRLPGRVPPGSRIPDLVRLFDVAPTVLELTGAEGPDVDAFVAAMDGKSLAPYFEGGPVAARKIFLESENCPLPEQRPFAPGMICDPPGVGGKIRAVFDGRYKLILTPKTDGRSVELYDLLADPGELHDLSSLEPARVNALSEEIDAYWEIPAERPAIDRALSEQLRALGYTE